MKTDYKTKYTKGVIIQNKESQLLFEIRKFDEDALLCHYISISENINHPPCADPANYIDLNFDIVPPNI